MKKFQAVSLRLALIAMLAGSLTACSTSAGTNAKLYLDNMDRILFTDTDTGAKAASAATASSTAASALETPSNFTVDGDTYSFTGVDGAAQYLMYLCEAGSTDDNDTYLYSGVIEATDETEYTGSVSEAVPHAYGEYTAKIFALDESYAMSAASTAEYSSSGELPTPEIAWSWDGQGTLSLQVANADDYDYAATPDGITVTLTGADGETAAEFDSTMADITVESLTAGDYTLTAVASGSSEYLTSAESAAGTVTMTLADAEAASDNYVAAQTGGGGGGNWTVTPTAATFAEGAESFSFVIGDMDFLKTTANLQAAPNEGSTYTYVLANGDAAAPFAAECIMTLELKSDGTAALSVTAAGPLNATNLTGTWTAADGNITLAW